MRLPRYTRVATYPPIHIGRPKQQILTAVGRFQYLSAMQVARLLFSVGSLTYVRRHLMELFHAAYLRRIFLPTITPLGSSRAIYCLDRKGYRHLKATGMAPEGRFHADEQPTREWLFLQHTLAANEILIAAHLLPRSGSGVTLAQMRTERELKRAMVYVPDGDVQIGLAPDSWLDLRQGAHQSCLAIELDRGTVERKSLQRKIGAYLEYARGPYQAAFGTQSLTVVFVTTSGQHRVNELLKWTEAALKARGAENRADLFRFAALDAALIEPDDLFFTAHFARPFAAVPVSLLTRVPDAQ